MTPNERANKVINKWMDYQVGMPFSISMPRLIIMVAEAIREAVAEAKETDDD